jgi:site-specific DNA-adenine methylase
MTERLDISRPAPLEHCGKDVKRIDLSDHSTFVYAAPTYMVFIERMWHGAYQQIPIDPKDIPELIEALEAARKYAERETVDA